MRRLTSIFALALILTNVLAPAATSAATIPSAATLAATAEPSTAQPSTPSALAASTPAGAVSPAAPLGPKVAIIVGPVHDGTARYEGYGDQVYNEAIKWTNNVVRVYSPNATWQKVVAAVTGASIVVNIGHGNGWPAPYPWDPKFTGRDGFGLNYDVNGDGKLSNFELRYYGEPSIRKLKMAPGAIVLLFHMCYASGNPEPGGPDPTLSVAKQRADNFASAFLAAGAKAVLAIGHSNDPYYIRTLFTTNQTLISYFLHAPDFKNHVMGFSSVRTAGALELLDPDTTAPTDFFRAYTGSTTARTTDVTGGAWVPTNADPSSLQVPGKATPAVGGRPAFGSSDDAVNGVNPTTTLPASQVLRVNSVVPGAASAADGSPIYDVSWGGNEGWMPGSSLTPRDSTPPRVAQVNDGGGSFSPNGDGVQDAMPLTVKLSETTAWSLQITTQGGTPQASASGSGDTASITWAPAPGAVSDGPYVWHLSATDPLGNGPLLASNTITVDRTAPVLTLDGNPAVPLLMSPNGDKLRDTVSFKPSSNKGGTATVTLRDAADTVVNTLNGQFIWTDTAILWDGRDTGGTVVPDGTYTASVTTTDLAGNTSAPQMRTIEVYSALGFVAAGPKLFFPQDLDTLAAASSLGFTLLSPATVDWTITNSSSAVVRTIKTAEALAAGPYAFVWDGRDDDGNMVPRGVYHAVVTGTDGTLSVTQTAVIIVDAFKIAVSDTTPGRTQKITVTVTTAEPLSTAVRMHVYQTGIKTWAVTLTKLTATTYRATIILRSSSVGTLSLKVSAKDKGGRSQASVLALPLH